MNKFINEVILPKVMAFVNTKAMRALQDGLAYMMPAMIIGSVFLLIGSFPYKPFTEWLAAIGVKAVFDQAATCTFNIIGIIAAVGVAYTYVKNEGFKSLPAGVISLCCYLIMQPASVPNADGGATDAIVKSWVGSQGLIGAIIIGLIVGAVYSYFLRKNITIKMPDGVPEGVANSFVSLVPGAVLVIGSAVLFGLCQGLLQTTPLELIFKMLQMPLQGLTDSFGGALAMAILISFLWFFGIHGTNVVGGVVTAFIVANSNANLAMMEAGNLSIEAGGFIVTHGFVKFITLSGAGCTLGAIIFMAFFAKSTRMKSLGRLGFLPGCFNINEPILFGTPFVLNPMLAVPFILIPIINTTLAYVTMALGIVPLNYATVPWTTPPIVSGMILGGFRGALLQVIMLGIAFVIYTPFLRKIDQDYLKAEQEG